MPILTRHLCSNSGCRTDVWRVNWLLDIVELAVS